MKDYGYYRYGRQRQYRRSSGSGSIALGLIILAVFCVLIVGGCAVGCQSGSATFTVQEKGIKRGSGNSSDKYLIYTNKETFEDTDSHLPGHWKTDSSDLYGRLKVGHTYTCSTLGARISLFSSYRNLIKCHEVSQ